MNIPPAVDNLRLLARDVRRAVQAQRSTDALHTAAPPATGFVLDVGAGHAPNPRADLVVDKYVSDNFERNTDLSFAKPLVVGDGQALPFADGTFAYVIASHVLEHATEPEVFAAELSRVAAAGWVQVPSRESELSFGWPFHPWLIDLAADETLVFHARGGQEAPIGKVFHEAAHESYLFRLWMASNRSLWYHSVHWRDALRVEDRGAGSTAAAIASFDVEESQAILRRSVARGPDGALRAALRCPVDRGTLSESGERMTCADCGRSYPVIGTVPMLIAEAAT